MNRSRNWRSATASWLAPTLGAATLASADPLATCAPEAGPAHRVARVVDGETVRLDDGSDVRLIGALAPRPDRLTTDLETWPPAREARRALETLALNRTVVLRYEGRRQDRYGRILAQLEVLREGEPPVWAQQHMVAAGLARAYALPGNTGCLSPLWVAEARARRDKKGLWSGDAFPIFTADDVSGLLRLVGRFVVVEGRVLAVARTRQLTYINFGSDWRDDFTVSLRNTAVDRSENGETRAQSLEGRRLRVRGWIERRNGPMIELSNLDEIEVLDGDSERAASAPPGRAGTADEKTPR